ncbi:MAG TPA: CBS domain-containing protein [Pyrinomonadaceae bacterium]|nr:CBS domain-containing protein [Pyrinomonadaceae bacterium]
MNCPSCGHENIDGTDRCENCLAPFRDLDVPRADSAEGLARSVMEDDLARLESEALVAVSPDTPALEVARRMKQANTGCALIIDANSLVGIFTEHDVLLRMTSAPPMTSGQQLGSSGGGLSINQLPATEIPFEELNADETPAVQSDKRLSADFDVPVRELMSPNPETLHQTDSVAEALNRMSLGRYRHLPIKKSDGSYAVASIKSVLSYIAKEDW